MHKSAATFEPAKTIRKFLASTFLHRHTNPSGHVAIRREVLHAAATDEPATAFVGASSAALLRARPTACATAATLHVGHRLHPVAHEFVVAKAPAGAVLGRVASEVLAHGRRDGVVGQAFPQVAVAGASA